MLSAAETRAEYTGDCIGPGKCSVTLRLAGTGNLSAMLFIRAAADTADGFASLGSTWGEVASSDVACATLALIGTQHSAARAQGHKINADPNLDRFTPNLPGSRPAARMGPGTLSSRTAVPIRTPRLTPETRSVQHGTWFGQWILDAHIDRVKTRASAVESFNFIWLNSMALLMRVGHARCWAQDRSEATYKAEESLKRSSSAPRQRR